jgi:hypothetical protein
MASKKQITRDDIMPMEKYAAVRKQLRQELRPHKRARQVPIGPVATATFESYDSMWHQVHEMLFIERGGEAQIPDELEAYNPLIPKGRELVATVMFEIDDRPRRQAFLAKLGGVEETMFLRFAGEEVVGRPEADVDRSTADGKASSVQFVHFPFTDAQVEAFRRPGTEVVIGFTHPQYAHMTVMPEETRQALAADFD